MSDPLGSVSPPHRIRVRYCETDRMGIAHHGVYAAWFEEARTEWMRAQGSSYREFEEQGYKLPIIEMTCRYKRSVTYDDELLVTTTLLAQSAVRFTLGYEIHRCDDGSLVATGTTELACLGPSGRPTRLPFSF